MKPPSIGHRLVLLFLLALPSAAQAPLFAKDVAAPPEDIRSGVVRLPAPEDLAVLSRSALVPVSFAKDTDGRQRFRVEVPLQEVGPLSLAFLASDVMRWEASVRVPGLPAAPLDALERAGFAGRWTGEPDAFPGLLVDRFDLPVVPARSVTIEITAPDELAAAGGHLLVAAAGDARLESTVSTLRTLADEPVAITARLVAGRADASIERAELHLRIDGTELLEPLYDDGLHGDGAPADGLYGAWVPYGLSGDAHARVVARGADANGGGFLLTAQHAFPLLERAAALTGEVTRVVRDEQRLGLRLGLLHADVPRKLQVAAEVWGPRTKDGELVPVAWLAKMIAPGEPAELVLDGRWLNRAGVTGPLELRRVRVQDPGTSVPFDEIARLDVPGDALPAVVGRAPGPPGPIVPAMRSGPAPFGAPGAQRIGAGFAAEAGGRVDVETGSSPALVLTHGYCSGGGVWPEAHFSEPKMQFSDPNQNRTHDEFALLLRDFASDQSSFGIVGHSQGGCAALHLLNFYWSGLDLAQGPRRIQAVASPFQGTPLAALGDLGPCGANADMTPAGSTTWLAGITSASRDEVYSWTTSQAGTFGCVPFIGLILASPNDGTVEQFRGFVPGGHDMGHTVGWCHTTGMSDPANYTDASRNANLDAQAAR